MSARAVFDTVTLLQAAANPAGPSGGCLRLVTEGRVILHLSEAGLAELADVVGRAKVRKRFPQITDEAVDTFLAGLRSLARVAGEVPPTFRYGRDPDDEHILNLALMTGSSYIVTRDNDLLDLMKEGNADGRSLKALQPSLTVLAPPGFLDAMSAPPSDADHPGAAEAPGGEGRNPA